MDGTIGKSNMSLLERDLRSKIIRLISGRAIMRGTLSEKARSCGKAGCKCARGEKHSSLYVAFSQEGKTQHIYVPKHREKEVTQWIQQYQQVQELLEDLSQAYLGACRFIDITQLDNEEIMVLSSKAPSFLHGKSRFCKQELDTMSGIVTTFLQNVLYGLLIRRVPPIPIIGLIIYSA